MTTDALSITADEYTTLDMRVTQPTFNGLTDEDGFEYLETLECNARREAADTKEIVLRISFREGLQGKAAAWYRELSSAFRKDWSLLKVAFESKYPPKDTENFENTFLIQQEIYNLTQGAEETDVQYLKRVDRLNKRCPITLHSEVAKRTLGGLHNVDLQYRVQTHLLLSGKIDANGLLVENIKLKDIRQAFVAATHLIGKQNTFEVEDGDHEEDHGRVTQDQINMEMLRVLKSFTAKDNPKTTPLPPQYPVSAVSWSGEEAPGGEGINLNHKFPASTHTAL